MVLARPSVGTTHFSDHRSHTFRPLTLAPPDATDYSEAAAAVDGPSASRGTHNAPPCAGEDLSWCRLSPESLMMHVGRRLAADMPALRTLTLVCSLDMDNMSMHRSLPISTALTFSSAMSPLCSSAQLSAFHFCSVDSCVTWEKWGQADEKRSYAEREDHNAWHLEAYT
ncbi:hypothetical protein C8R44DRAFT_891309 [Mycena epipterygia]|nr:hypothetical protein C8R44DRAFT_891309 [Mycena epipterygia]